VPRPPRSPGPQAPKPSAGPHKTRECLPLILLLRNRLKYALTGKEVTSILMQRLVEVDGKVRTDKTYPVGFMDVVDIPKTGEQLTGPGATREGGGGGGGPGG
jgi:small subunit ribosomal protein S4e